MAWVAGCEHEYPNGGLWPDLITWVELVVGECHCVVRPLDAYLIV